MPRDDERLLSRIDALINGLSLTDEDMTGTNATLQGTLTLVRTLYGMGSAQEGILSGSVKAAQSAKDGAPFYNFDRHVKPAVLGTLRAIKGDVENGLVGDLRRRAVGEVVADMLLLAKEALADKRDAAKNVAAVLAAASFEDTIRKMGSAFAQVEDRRDLADVLSALKKSAVLEGAPFTTAQGYLKFRNDALHADWDKLDASVIGSCITFVEHLLLKHFS
jgi:hypothetical protein